MQSKNHSTRCLLGGMRTNLGDSAFSHIRTALLTIFHESEHGVCETGVDKVLGSFVGYIAMSAMRLSRPRICFRKSHLSS